MQKNIEKLSTTERKHSNWQFLFDTRGKYFSMSGSTSLRNVKVNHTLFTNLC